MHQTGFITRMYRDARSSKQKKGTSCVSMAAGVTRTHYSGTLYAHFLSRYLTRLDNVAPVMVDRNDPTWTSDYGALGFTQVVQHCVMDACLHRQLSSINVATWLGICTASDQTLIVTLSVVRIICAVLHSTDNDWGLRSWPWQWFAHWKVHRPLYVTSNWCVQLKIQRLEV